MLNLAPSRQAASPNVSRQGIVWLASYPKSGNTWFRIFLRNLLHQPEENDEISGLTNICSDRKTFDDLSGLDSSNLTPDEIDELRPRVYEEIVLQNQGQDLPTFIKAHDAFTYLPDGQPLLSRTATAGAIYFLRNPLDVAVSFAYHAGHEDFTKAIQTMGRTGQCFSDSKDELKHQLRQRLLDWSGHVRSWLEQTDVPVHVVKYEDMLSDPLQTFRGAIRFAGLDHDDSQVAAALEESRFEKLQQQERDKGFRERYPRSKVFFREGKAGAWRNKLTEEMVAKVIADHGEVMRHYKYLDQNNVVLV